MSATSGDRGDEPTLFHGDDPAGSPATPTRKRPNDPERRAQDLVYRQLAVRARSHAELTQTLQRNGIEEDIATRVLHKFCNAGLVDDAAFAENWVRERHQHRGLSRAALVRELRRKGVDESLIAAALATVDDDTQVERAQDLVRRKLSTMTTADGVTRFRRLVGMLARKGYSENLAFRVVRKELEEAGLDTAADESAIS